MPQDAHIKERGQAGPAVWSRNFTLFFTARSVSMLGASMIPLATALGVSNLGYGATGVGLALAAWMGPFAVLILFGGVFADKFTPRRMMIGADLVRTVTQGGLAALYAFTHPPLWQILALSAVSGVAAAMYQPGVSSTVPRVARDVQRGNASLRVSEAIMMLAGPAVAGGIITLSGVGTVFAIEAVGFAISAVCLLALRLPPLPAGEDVAEESMWRNLRGGWHEFRSRTWMWSVILIWVVFGITLFGPMIPLGSVLVSEALGDAAYGLVMSASGAGTIVGGLVAMRLRPARPLMAGAIGLFGFTLEPLSIATAMPLEFIMAAHVIGGTGWAFWSVMWATSIQTHVPQEALNRVTAYEVGGSTVAIPIGQALAGPLSGWLGAQEVLLLSSAVAVGGCTCLLLIPAVRGLRRITLGADPHV
ncbi:MFS transporter [Planobispora rosea]|uniref:MFS transporter n=1 Tax=Planobispora rosea TaxID=35762 RepID=A0A8J3RZY3_PLARO|nr:MFS transporter [Planobispora rosea]GGS62660.1 MFS transporter [Planobispora rosea]GIH84284.1 MFS transporter [Planobispora rosea]